MNNGWNEIRLGTIAELITKGTTPTTIGGSFSDKVEKPVI